LTAPVLGELARRAGLTVYTQDDPSFPDTVPGPVHDLALDVSHQLKIEIVPTLIRLEGGREIARTYGWDRGEWERLTGVRGLGGGLPEQRPGCGAKNVEPGVLERSARGDRSEPGAARQAHSLDPGARPSRRHSRRCGGQD